MDHAELAQRLLEADDEVQAELLNSHAPLADVNLARELKQLCTDYWNTDPHCAHRAAKTLEGLAALNREPEVAAFAAWTAGYAALVAGQMRVSINHFDEAEAAFNSIGQAHTAAETQVIKLYPLAMLGRYDEAVECGLRARAVFVAHGDALSAGKIEHNIGNIYQRRDRYREAENFLRAARERFAEFADEKRLAQIDNSLANTLSFQHKFRAAEALHKQALERAERAGLLVTQAEIESKSVHMKLAQTTHF